MTELSRSESERLIREFDARPDDKSEAKGPSLPRRDALGRFISSRRKWTAAEDRQIRAAAARPRSKSRQG